MTILLSIVSWIDIRDDELKKIQYNIWWIFETHYNDCGQKTKRAQIRSINFVKMNKLN